MKWEYTARTIHETIMQIDAVNMLNEFGSEGWECVGVIDQGKYNADGKDTKTFYFKRPKE